MPIIPPAPSASPEERKAYFEAAGEAMKNAPPSPASVAPQMSPKERLFEDLKKAGIVPPDAKMPEEGASGQ